MLVGFLLFMALKFQALTRKATSGLVVGQKITEHGITVERTGKGDLIYRVGIMVDGRRIHRTVGRESEGVTRRHAEEKIEEFRTKEREGNLSLPIGRKNHFTFEAAAAEYLVRLERGGGKDIANKRRHLEAYLTPYFRSCRADRVTTMMVAEYVQHRLAEVKQATVNRELSTLSHLLNRLVEWKWIKADDKPTITKGNEARKPITVLTETQASALMKAATEDSDSRLFLFVAFGLNAAMRHSEIVASRYDQVDFDNRRVFIPLAKAGEREQPITQALAGLLLRQRRKESDPQGWIFPANSSARTAAARASHRTTMEDGFRRAVIRAGLDPTKVTPHVMRHTAITRLVKAGVDLPTIQRISGHKTLAMVMRYVHLHGSHIDKAIASLDIALNPAITQELHKSQTGEGHASL
jgi:integrase